MAALRWCLECRCRDPGDRERCLECEEELLREAALDDGGGGEPSEEFPPLSLALWRLRPLCEDGAGAVGEPGRESVGLRWTSLSLLLDRPSPDVVVLDTLAASGGTVGGATPVDAGDSLIMLRNLASRFLRSS